MSDIRIGLGDQTLGLHRAHEHGGERKGVSVNLVHVSFIRHYHAPLPLADGGIGTWYGEHDGIYTVREFIIRADNRTMVAPFDLAFCMPGHPTEPPALLGIAAISLRDFEALWEQYSQPRLNELAVAPPAQTADGNARYFHQPFPDDFKVAEAASDIYAEFAADVARRSFEVFADRTQVAPFDALIPDVSTAEMLRAAYEAVDLDGETIDPLLRPEEIGHAAFETQWEQHALPRLRMLAELS